MSDLLERGLFDPTLVVRMGELGRTPNVNNGGGRDPWSRAWSSVLVGGGIRGGRAVGRTDATGATVTDRPISAKDFLATVCTVLGVDYTKKVNAGGRPTRVVDSGERVVREVL